MSPAAPKRGSQAKRAGAAKAGTAKRVAAVKRVAAKTGASKTADAAAKPARSRTAKRKASGTPSGKGRAQAAERSRCMVLGYDATESGRRAATWAATELHPSGKLVLVYSERSLHAPASPLSSAHERDAVGRAQFDELLLDGSPALLDIDFATELSRKDPVSALIGAAKRHQADAIVVGSGSHSRLRRMLGVVTDELLERSPVPVIAVPAGVKLRRTTARPRRAARPRARSG